MNLLVNVNIEGNLLMIASQSILMTDWILIVLHFKESIVLYLFWTETSFIIFKHLKSSTCAHTSVWFPFKCVGTKWCRG